jgi:hypothetical protein
MSRKITRLSYGGPLIVDQTKVYTLEEVSLTINRMQDLADGLLDLLDVIHAL